MTKQKSEEQSLLEQVRDAADVFAEYNGGEDMPLGGYATLLGIFNSAFIALLAAAQKDREEKLPERVNFADLILLGAATHKLSSLIAKDRVTSPLRAPFTEYVEPAGENEVKEKSRGSGLQRAVGDLLTCPWCVSPWVAAGLAFGFVFKPRAARFVAGVFTAVTIADFLHHAHDAAKEKDK